MAFKTPYSQHHYIGEFANDTAALTFIQTNLWDSAKNGTGNPEEGMLYYDTTLLRLKVYMAGGIAAWKIVPRQDLVMLLDGTQAMTGNMNLGSQRITALASPVDDNDAANKTWVLSQIQGLDPKASVDGATTTTLPANTRTANTLTADAFGAFPTIDTTVTAALNNEYLIKDEADGIKNGIYVLTTVGDGSTAWVLERRDDMVDGTNAAGAYLPIERGTANGDKLFLCTTDKSAAVVGTDSLTWANFSASIDHNTTLNKQGGTTDEYYHLTSANYTTLRGGSSDASSLHNHTSLYPNIKTGAGNPNAGAGTAGKIGDLYIDTVSPYLRYINVTGAATAWEVI